MALRIAVFLGGGRGRGETIKKALWLFIVYKKTKKQNYKISDTCYFFYIYVFTVKKLCDR